MKKSFFIVKTNYSLALPLRFNWNEHGQTIFIAVLEEIDKQNGQFTLCDFILSPLYDLIIDDTDTGRSSTGLLNL